MKRRSIMRLSKFISTLFAILLFAGSAFADVRNVQDNYKFVYSVIDTAGDPVGSQTVNLSIQRASDAYYLDFADTTFKASGWSNKTTALTEDSTNGLYSYTFNPPASETGPEEYIFTVDNASATYGDHQSMTVCYQSVNTSSVIVTTNNDKTGYTASTVSDKTGYSLTQAFPTNFSSLAITSGGAVTAGTVSDKTGYTVSTVSDKTGYSLGASQTFSTTGSVGSVTGSVDSVTDPVTAGTVTDKTGYALTQTFPTNFSVLAISATTGKVTVGTNDDKTGYALSTAGINAVADGVFDEALSGHTTVGTFGEAMQNLTYYTNGQKDGGVYNGIENMIRSNR